MVEEHNSTFELAIGLTFGWGVVQAYRTWFTSTKKAPCHPKPPLISHLVVRHGGCAVGDSDA
jgi:hypothetical protein